MHYRVGLSDFSRADYAGYLRVNRTVASALAKLVCPSDLVWVHDYHLIPLAAELRVLGLTNPIGYFHHIPWPAPEVLGNRKHRSSALDHGFQSRWRADRTGRRQP
jgi:trehalose 6-phosphate synthase